MDYPASLHSAVSYYYRFVSQTQKEFIADLYLQLRKACACLDNKNLL